MKIQAPASMSPAHLHQYTASISPGQLSESLPSSQVNTIHKNAVCLSPKTKKKSIHIIHFFLLFFAPKIPNQKNYLKDTEIERKKKLFWHTKKKYFSRKKTVSFFHTTQKSFPKMSIS